MQQESLATTISSPFSFSAGALDELVGLPKSLAQPNTSDGKLYRQCINGIGGLLISSMCITFFYQATLPLSKDQLFKPPSICALVILIGLLCYNGYFKVNKQRDFSTVISRAKETLDKAVETGNLQKAQNAFKKYHELRKGQWQDNTHHKLTLIFQQEIKEAQLKYERKLLDKECFNVAINTLQARKDFSVNQVKLRLAKRKYLEELETIIKAKNPQDFHLILNQGNYDECWDYKTRLVDNLYEIWLAKSSHLF